MAVTRVPRIALVTAGLAMAAATLLIDLPRQGGGRFWSDGATYHAMAGSLARDFDLRYDPQDLARIQAEYPGGPTGLFLKKVGDRLYYSKSVVYPLVCAPFVRVLGGTRGLVFVNGLSLILAIALGLSELRRRGLGDFAAVVVVLGLFVCSVLPLYVWWLTPEVFSLALVTLALVSYARGRVIVAAVLLGIAAYAKPPNVFLAIPLLLEPLLEKGPTFARRLLESVRRGVVLSAVVGVFFGLTYLLTGAFNYQGGDRKTFYSKFPYESADATFETGGIWMSTEHLGPLVAGADEGKQDVKTGPVRSAEELRVSFLWNLGYYWVGRFGGVLPYFPAIFFGVVLFLLRGGRDARGWLCLLSLLSSYVFFIWLIPDNWYGGGGTVGNRYFLNLLPLGLFILPKGREWMPAVLGGVVGMILMGPVLASPIEHSLRPGEHATWRTFKTFPPELTMLNDLSVFTETWRKKRPYGDTEGDARSGRLADANAYYLYFMDNGAYGREDAFGRRGFWLRGGSEAEIVLRALEPVKALRFRMTGGPGGDIVDVRYGSGAELTLRPQETKDTRLVAPGAGFPYYDTELSVLRFRSRGGRAASAGDPRVLGAFVEIEVDADRHP
jgi:hypothetical protein